MLLSYQISKKPLIRMNRTHVETTLFLADSTWIETTNAVVMKLSEKIYLSKH